MLACLGMGGIRRPALAEADNSAASDGVGGKPVAPPSQFDHHGSEHSESGLRTSLRLRCELRNGRPVKRITGGLLVMLGLLTACDSVPTWHDVRNGQVEFTNSGNTQYLTAGKYAVAVSDDCGTPVQTVAGQITGHGWSDPLLAGTPLSIPISGDYTVVDPIGSDLMVNTPQCRLALTVGLTPVTH
jgi:hypothetical protein